MNDEIISAFPFRDFVLIITKGGKVYKLRYGDIYERVEVSLLANLDLKL
jgi:hypothetical protein